MIPSRFSSLATTALFVLAGAGCMTGSVGMPSGSPGSGAGPGGSGGTQSAGSAGSSAGPGAAGTTGQTPGTGGQVAGSSGAGAGGSAAGAGGRGGGAGNGGSAGSQAAGSTGRGGAGGASGQTGGAAGRGGAAGGTVAGAGGQTGGAGGQAGGAGGAPAGSCTDGKKNGTETGVDCGGSCVACPNYKINPPNKMNNAQSSCNGGPGYMCARSMLFSPEFKQAAMDDWGGAADPPFVYGTVGHDPDTGGVDSNSNTCCQCYQLIFESPQSGVSGVPTPKPMIVQTFNTAAGGGKNFDIYMAAGGLGNFNGCTGGASAMYDGFPDLGGNYSGGVRATRYSQCSAMNMYTAASIGAPMCQDYVSSQCGMIKASASPTNQSTSQTSCVESNTLVSLYHANWNVRAKRVECPTNLTRVTGCKLNGQGLPQADPNAKDAASADSSYRTGYSTTTMQDCCRPTCAWPTNVTMNGVSVDSSYALFYTCDKAGNPATQ